MAMGNFTNFLHYLDGKEAATEVKSFMQSTVHNLDDVKRSSSIFSLQIVDHLILNILIGKLLRENLRKWQSPPDASVNHNFASDRHHKGTAKWFCTGNTFEKWKVTGSLLWIHGKRTLRLRFV
jgi:hypothetical protein